VRRTILAVALLLGATACTPEQIQAFLTITEEHADELSRDQLLRLRRCESGDDYTAVGGGGRYRGAYQFSRPTWNGVARRHYPWLEGRDPARVEPWWQDAMARALWSERGRHPWPHCGRQVGRP
jgi:hypothetical protein